MPFQPYLEGQGIVNTYHTAIYISVYKLGKQRKLVNLNNIWFVDLISPFPLEASLLKHAKRRLQNAN